MQYFKHMSNMRNDVKLRRVITRYGIEGYGLYNIILESITETLTTNSPMPDLQETCADLAQFYNGDTTRIDEMVSFMLHNGLFEVDEISRRITCKKIYKFLEASQIRSIEIREMITKYKHLKELPEPSQNVINVCDKSEEENRIEENRIDKSKIDSQASPDTIPYSQIIKALNETAGTRYTAKAQSTRRLIHARWNEGYRLPDFENVISSRWEAWKSDEKMVQYLRPQTLFGTKMEGYLQKVKPQKTDWHTARVISEG